MRVHRQAQATTDVVVFAVLLGSLWACALAASGPGTPMDQLTASRSLLGLEPAALPDRAAALRPSAERSAPGGRLLLPLLLGLAAASITNTNRVPTRRRQSSHTLAQSPVLAASRGPRAPPRLQPG